MHLGSGAITAECVVLTAGAAGAGLAAAGLALRRTAPSRDNVLLAAGLSALVFAAQAINVPVWPGVSAHLVGGVLLAWAVGPALGAVAMSLVLVLQTLWLGDGGLIALPANVLNMALVPAALVALVRRVSCSRIAAGMAALASLPLAAGLIVIQTSLFRGAEELAGWSSFAALMVATHLWIGVLEAGLTIGGLAAIGWLSRHADSRVMLRPAIVTLTAGVVLAALAVSLSSALPDGYEAAAERGGRDGLLTEDHAELARLGSLHVGAASAQQAVVAGVQNIFVSQQVCLLVATLVVAGTLLAAGHCAARRFGRPAEE